MDLNDHPFSHDSVAYESGHNPGETSWLRWINAAERLIGYGLDGNQDAAGYSLDFAMDAFTAGRTPEQYVLSVRSNPAYCGDWRADRA